MSESKSPRLMAAAIGRRKASTASVRLYAGAGGLTVNSLPAESYFSSLPLAKTRYLLPFTVTDTLDSYSVEAKVSGGGPSGQLDSLVLGVARALVKARPSLKLSLRQAGLLTRDPRVRQRRMVGTGGKARRKKQSPKR